MKRIIAFVFSVVLLCTALPMTAFAAPLIPHALTNIKEIGNGADILDDRNVEDFGDIILGSANNVLEIPIKYQNFTPKVGFSGALQPSDVNRSVMRSLTLKCDPADALALFEPSITYKEYMGGHEAVITLTSFNIGEVDGWIWVEEKDSGNTSERIRIKGRFLDPTIDKSIVGIADRPLDFLGATLNGVDVTSSLGNLAVRPGSELLIKLDTDSFVWDPLIGGMRAGVRKSTLDADNISLMRTVLNGNKLIKDFGLKNVDGRAYAYVLFIDDFEKAKDTDFEFLLGLGQDKRLHEPTSVKIMGYYGHETIEVDADTDFVSIEGGEAIEPSEFVRNIRVYLGSGVTLTTSLEANKRYTGSATDVLTDLDREILENLPEFKKVLHVSTVGFRSTAQVTIESDDLYYIYDGEGKYLGTVNETLPLRKTYYFASMQRQAELDFPDELDLEDNSNDNPSTGSGALGALGAGSLLLLAGALLPKKGSRMSKKIWSSMFAFVLVVSMAVTGMGFEAFAVAPPNQTIAYITPDFYLDMLGNPIVTPEQARPGDEILIPLMKKGFEDANGAIIEWSTVNSLLGPSVEQLRQNRVTVNLTAQAGHNLIRDVQIVRFTPTKRIPAQAAIRVRFIEGIVNTRENRYEFKVRVSLNGKIEAESIPLDGMLSNPIVELHAGDDYIYIGDSEVAVCRDSVTGIQVDIGSGVSLYTDLIKGEKYFGIARCEEDSQQDDAIRRAYREIAEIYTLNTVNLKTDGTRVKFTDIPDSAPFYVYNESGEYIGTTKERLPYSTKYYLTTALIELDPELIASGTGTSSLRSEAFKEFSEKYLAEVESQWKE